LYGSVTAREDSGRVGVTLQTLSHGLSVKANQIASAPPAAVQEVGEGAATARIAPAGPGTRT